MIEINEISDLKQGDIIFNPVSKSKYRVDKSIYNIHAQSQIVSMTPISPYIGRMFSFSMRLDEMIELGYQVNQAI